MPRYAATTEVSSDRSRAEVEKTLIRYGATGFLYGWEGAQAMVGFRMHGRQIRFLLPLPDRNSDEFRLTPSRQWERSEKQQSEAYEQAVRQRWRALALVVKAKLEAVEAGISEFESEFLANIVLPNGQTYGDFAIPQIADVYAEGRMPVLLPGAERKALPAGSR